MTVSKRKEKLYLAILLMSRVGYLYIKPIGTGTNHSDKIWRDY